MLKPADSTSVTGFQVKNRHVKEEEEDDDNADDDGDIYVQLGHIETHKHHERTKKKGG